MKYLISIGALILHVQLSAQHDLKGKISDGKEAVPYAKIKIPSLNKGTLSDDKGNFSLKNIPEGKYALEIFAHGYEEYSDSVLLPSAFLDISLLPIAKELGSVVVSGTLEETSKKESTVNVEVYTPKFFKKNPTASVYDALQGVNGVRPQLNCNICNTGDIHINGLEGSYTMVLIDGMPIVSSLSTVYGLFGIPNSIIERIEIVKGPASTLYGSEAIGGIINIITKKAQNAPVFSADAFTSSWLETNVDLAVKNSLGKKTDVLTGLNYFNYNLPVDNNSDSFTDLTLQNRISVFQKWNFKRKDLRVFTIAGRYLYEDRWGGEMNWVPEFRGSDSIYGESIYTNRFELISTYQLPLKEKVFLSTSMNRHQQNSYYGTTSFMADQVIGFGQLHWSGGFKKNKFLVGMAYRYTYYDDNSTATEKGDSVIVNTPSITHLPGVFVQHEYGFNDKNKLLLGLRYDYNSLHGSILTPRIGYKWDPKYHSTFRLNAGTGYRVVNIYTEDHAALTGAREVLIDDDIRPETSYNANLNYTFDKITKKEKRLILDLTLFYTYFTNKIIADYDSDPDKIIYSNVSSHAINRGISTNITLDLTSRFKIISGFTFMDVANFDNGVRSIPVLSERFTATWSISYEFKKGFVLDYTGNVYSPMRLPVLTEMDPRPDHSPWWSIQNIQLTFDGWKNWEIYGGVKNLLNWTPDRSADFLIARAHDPFDKLVQYDVSGAVVPTSENPHALTFDPSYVYAPNQGIRGFLGVRYTLKR